MSVELEHDPWIQHALNVIWKDYGVRAYVADRTKDLLKFGRSEQVNATTYTTLMTMKTGTTNETYLATNAIDTISSSSGSDTEEIVVEGHTLAAGKLTFVTQTVTLTGQTKATLGTPLARASRAYANGSTDLVGQVYIYEDGAITTGVPDTGADVHLVIRLGQNQTEKCAVSVEDQNYWIVTSVTLDVLHKTSAFADGVLEVASVGGIFRPRTVLSAASGAARQLYFNPHIIIPANSDVRMRALGSATISVAGQIHGVLAIVRS